MNKMIRSLFCAVSFAFGAQTMHAGVSFADMQANAKKATRFDHAITILSAIGMIKGLTNYDWRQVYVWGCVACSSAMGTVFNNKKYKKNARFQAGGALVFYRMFGMQDPGWNKTLIDCQPREEKERIAFHNELNGKYRFNRRAELYGSIAGFAAFYLDEKLLKKKK